LISSGRAYRNLKWSREGAKEGELIFVSGHPAGSSRLATMAELQFRRDELYPESLARLKARIEAVKRYGSASAESERVGRAVVFSAENSQKRYVGFLAGLRDPKVMQIKAAEEKKLRDAVAKNPAMRKEYGGVWDEVGGALKKYSSVHKRYGLLEMGAGTGSDLFSIARTIVRLSEEKTKPNEQRLHGYTEADMRSVERRLYSEAPITDSFEAAVLAEYFDYLAKSLGASDPAVKAVLAGKTPEAAAKYYVSGSQLKDVAVRRKLAGDRAALAASKDTMIELARRIDGPARAVRKQYEDDVEAVLTAAKSKIAQARFELYGANEYPDSTATLRLAYGAVKGYRNKAGKQIPWATDFNGMFGHATGQDPFRLPQRWLNAKGKLALATPFDYVGTTDTHGGNSGSPTVNTKGEIVGILFDSNLEKLPNEFVYTEDESRSVHVASQGIIEALRSVYNAQGLVKELLGQ
jgi:hypothetical protein